MASRENKFFAYQEDPNTYKRDGPQAPPKNKDTFEPQFKGAPQNTFANFGQNNVAPQAPAQAAPRQVSQIAFGQPSNQPAQSNNGRGKVHQSSMGNIISNDDKAMAQHRKDQNDQGLIPLEYKYVSK